MAAGTGSTIQVPNIFLPTPQHRETFPRVSLALHGADAMYAADNPYHYLSVGMSALTIIQAAMQVAGNATARQILDFGSGAGRVTRWLRAGWPSATITAADIREADLPFCAEAFGARVWNPGIDLDAMEPPGRFDLIWLGSVITHLSAEKVRRLLRLLLEWSNRFGLVVLSFHGRQAFSRGVASYALPAAAVPGVEADYRATGFGYADYARTPGYGVSFSAAAWILAEVESIPGCRLVLLSEGCWDGHHDVVALQKL